MTRNKAARVFHSCALLAALLFLLPELAYAASSGGIDTPDGVTNLPLGVQGTAGVNLSIPAGSPSTTIPDTEFYGNAVFDKSVGIGTATPEATLDVNGTVRPQSAVEGNDCTPLGAQAYNATSGSPLFCGSSTKWESTIPAGQVAFYAMPTCPSGWIMADGSTVSRTAYTKLFAVIHTIYGMGNGSTTFTLPDLRGSFIRGWDDGRGYDIDRAFGSNQSDQFAAHTHMLGTRDSTVTFGTGLNKEFTADYGTPLSVTSSSTGGTETRPKNVAMLPCIKF